MVFVGYHASHEQLPPSTLLRAVTGAERAGFDGAMCSDHLAPWGVAQGESGFAWSWLGAALASTDFSIGVVNAPGQRYHPVVIAQAVATLEEMFPGRFWAVFGSGEAMNEHVTGDPWPSKDERNARLDESLQVIRRLLGGDEVTQDGLVKVHRARVWSRPAAPPPLLGAAVSAETAEWLAGRVDGLATVAQEPAALRRVVDAYRGAGGEGPCVLQVHLSLAETDTEALALAKDQWPNGLIGPPRAWDFDQPEDFDAAVADPDEGELRKAVLVDTDAAALAERIAELVRIGFDRVYLHHVGKNQDEFLDRAESDLLPALRRTL
ncbi:TIGR03885 family FMN-dependent LLM class oxidoreductase [Microbacterium sp. CFBP9034]|uniref:TIGR03885 family FMN-dependent LLM class oxidoreductase n=1 Tax=Microbacterium sp. CFBP9034 TaxID=3096540 RepID=UPI002A69EB44|nr:TIGR03885 family FMN-dependent LLM class oxidoreductase [Microbacterium sp. CFBP9034]MDY0908747.1 TIGR03885 family FMN-dependent LLM class oxidoreductase [Microbacterium sp. CFBP9034]